MRTNKRNNILKVAKILIENPDGFPSITALAQYLNMNTMTVYNALKFISIYVDFHRLDTGGIALPNLPIGVKIKPGTSLEMVSRFIDVKEQLKGVKESEES